MPEGHSWAAPRKDSQYQTRSITIETINVPVVFMARYIMVLRGATSLRGALEGVGPENRDFFWPWSEASAIWAQKSRDFHSPPHPMTRVMMLHPSNPLSISAIKTTGTLVVLCTRVLLLCVVVCKRGGQVSLQLCCVRRYSGGGGWLAGLLLPLPL